MCAREAVRGVVVDDDVDGSRMGAVYGEYTVVVGYRYSVPIVNEAWKRGQVTLRMLLYLSVHVAPCTRASLRRNLKYTLSLAGSMLRALRTMS